MISPDEIAESMISSDEIMCIHTHKLACRKGQKILNSLLAEFAWTKSIFLSPSQRDAKSSEKAQTGNPEWLFAEISQRWTAITDNIDCRIIIITSPRRDRLIDEPRDGLRNELRVELRDELRDELGDELRDDLTNDARDEL